jgi:hypothetical protein
MIGFARTRAPDQIGGHMIAILGFLWWLLIVFFWIAFLALTMSIASSKGHNPWLWGILAVFFPLITVIVVLLIPERATE